MPVVIIGIVSFGAIEPALIPIIELLDLWIFRILRIVVYRDRNVRAVIDLRVGLISSDIRVCLIAILSRCVLVVVAFLPQTVMIPQFRWCFIALVSLSSVVERRTRIL